MKIQHFPKQRYFLSKKDKDNNRLCLTAKNIKAGGQQIIPAGCEECGVSQLLRKYSNDPRIKTVKTEADAIELAQKLLMEED